MKVPSWASHVPPNRHGEEWQSCPDAPAAAAMVEGGVAATVVCVGGTILVGLNGEVGESDGRWEVTVLMVF